MLETILVSLIALLLSAVVTKLVIRYSSAMGLISAPNHRSSHEVHVPHGGGIGFVCAFLFCLIYLYISHQIEHSVFLVLAGGGAIIATIGLIDDIRPLPVSVRFIIQVVTVLTAYIIIYSVVVPLKQSIGFSWSIYAHLLALFLMIWWLNLFNFMDGADGFAATECLVVLISVISLVGLQNDSFYLEWGSIQYLFVLLGASVAGFLLFNWPTAHIFMGDVGSTFLGYTTAVIALMSVLTGELSVYVWLIIGGVFWVDASVTLLTRFVTGQKWYVSHHSHTFQILARKVINDHAFSRSQAHQLLIGITIIINVLWLFPLAWATLIFPEHSFMILLIAWFPILFVVYYLGAGKVERNE